MGLRVMAINRYICTELQLLYNSRTYSAIILCRPQFWLRRGITTIILHDVNVYHDGSEANKLLINFNAKKKQKN